MPTLALILALVAGVEAPKSLDPRLTIDLFAAEPAIVTPTGIAVDDRGRVFVIECHTHFRPDDYQGPPTDRIRIFEDTDGDGRADRISTFFEGSKWTMALAFARDGSLYVATRAEVFRLRDLDGDGHAEHREPIAHLETPGNYPHNGLSGFAFDAEGNVYFGLGENLGAPYKLIGSDGSTLSGGGEGGSIYCCRADGSKLRRLATGFWNPFHLAFDAFGRLFAIDNDPDSRPPCRLLHIVQGGDYGYRFRNGRKGLHPFTAWDGELPGTLPMVAGTGEAPSGLVVYESDQLPDEYRGNLLVTSWGDHRIDRYRLRDRGASFRSAAEPIITGGEDFRPVGIATAPDGSLYVSDWVDKSYPVHGRGRIWHLRASKPTLRPAPQLDDLAHPDRRIREAAARRLAGQGADGRKPLAEAITHHADPRARAVALETLIATGDVSEDVARGVLRDRSADVRTLAARALPADRIDAPSIAQHDDSPAVRAEALRRITSHEAKPVLLKALESDDPFLLQAAREGLKHSSNLESLIDLADDDRPAVRLASLLILSESDRPEARRPLAKLLGDPDPTIRFAAIRWVGEQGLKEYRSNLAEGLKSGAGTRQLFEGYLAALERLDGVARDAHDEIGGDEYVAALLADPKTPDPVLRRALRVLRPDHPVLTLKRLRTLLDSADPGLRLEAIRTLRESPHPERFALLLDRARADSEALNARAEAIVGLSGDDPMIRSTLLGLAATGPPPIRLEALRSLRGAPLTAHDRDRLAAALADDPDARDLLSTLDAPDRQPHAPSPENLDAWLTLLDGPADAAAGERIFFHPKGPGCFRCHESDGRGGRIGPALSATARALDRRRLVDSILQPGREVAPMFVPWRIARTDGTFANGLLLGETLDGQQLYADEHGQTFQLRPSDVAERRPAPGSIMPDGLAHLMTAREFRDLLAYLRGSPPPADAAP